MPITGMSSIWYPVNDWDRAKQFYSEVLGLRLNACSDAAGWAALSAGSGGTPFFLVKKTGAAGKGGGGVVGFDVIEPGELLARIAVFGCMVDDNVQESDSVRIYTVYDPDGNAVELSEALAAV